MLDALGFVTSWNGVGHDDNSIMGIDAWTPAPKAGSGALGRAVGDIGVRTAGA
jgi:hypothetical protein